MKKVRLSLSSSTGADFGDDKGEYHTHYGDLGAGGKYYPSAADTDLQGAIKIYENCPAGNYTINCSGIPGDICVYYEPDVDLAVYLADESGNTVSGDMVSGTYYIHYGLADKNGSIINSPLLGNTDFEITYTLNGEQKTERSDKADKIEVKVNAGDKLDVHATATYLSGYHIERNGSELGWPVGGYKVFPKPAGKLEINLSGGADSYKLSQLEQEGIYNVGLLYKGQPLIGKALNSANIAVTVDGGNVSCEKEQTSEGFLIKLRYANSAEATRCGEYTLSVSASYVNEEAQTAKSDAVAVPFRLEDDSFSLQIKLDIPQNYYQISAEALLINEAKTVNENNPYSLEFLLKNAFGDVCHPNAARYMLYLAKIEMDKRVKSVDSEINDVITAGLETYSPDANNPGLFDVKYSKAHEKNLDEVCAAEKAIGEDPNFIDKLQGYARIYDKFNECFPDYFRNITELGEKTAELAAYKLGAEYLKELGLAYEGFYKTFKDKVAALVRKQEEIVNQLKFVKGDSVLNICAGGELLKELSSSTRSMREEGSMLDSELNAKIFDAVKANVRFEREIRSTDVVEEDRRIDVFDDILLGYFKDDVRRTCDNIDLNAVEAIAMENRLKNRIKLREQQDSSSGEKLFDNVTHEDNLRYIKKIIEIGERLSSPGIQRVSNEEPREVKLCAYNKSLLDMRSYRRWRSFMIKFLKILLSVLGITLPFLAFALLNSKANLKKKIRSRQLLMPILALIYEIVIIFLLSKLNNGLLSLLNRIPVWLNSFGEWIGGVAGGHLGFLGNLANSIGEAIHSLLISLNLTFWLCFISNLAIMLLYLIFKKTVLQISKAVFKKSNLLSEHIGGLFYIKDDKDPTQWYVKPNFGQGRTFLKTFYCMTSIIAVSTARSRGIWKNSTGQRFQRR